MSIQKKNSQRPNIATKRAAFRRIMLTSVVGSFIQAAAVAERPPMKKISAVGKAISFASSEHVKIQASGDGEAALPRFDIVAYNGGKMNVGWGIPVVVDLAGMKITSQSNPVRAQHEAAMGVGHTETVRVEGNKLLISGVVSRETEAAREVVASSKKGFPWQASIGASPEKYKRIRDDESVVVNGQTQQGPFYHVMESTFDEVSFVDLGADRGTSARIAAADEGSSGSGSDGTPPPEKLSASAPLFDIAAESKKAIDQIRAEAVAESKRVADIRQICAGAHSEIESKAISEGWTVTKTELEVLRASRPKAPGFRIVSGDLTTEIIEAACAQAARMPNIEESYDDKTLQAAHTRFRGNIGLQQLLLEAAWSNGFSGNVFRGNDEEVLRAAFPIRASGGFSTISVGGILSNVANKYIMLGFMGVEQAWREISAIRAVNDFKTITSYRLTGKDQYEKVAPSGEIKNGSFGEEVFTNKADTYGLMLGITRTDIRNDDLGAFTTVPQKLGRGAGLKINDVFWTAFMDNAAFFTVGLKNYLAGATTNLSVDALTTINAMFNDQVDADGKPLGLMAKILLVPNALEVAGKVLHTSMEVRAYGSTSKEATLNPHVGSFRPVRSSYLGNAAYTGNSTKAWYLLADPNELATIETCFLDGQENPTIQTAEADFNTLGIQMRGFHDFGVNKQDSRGGVKSKGEA